MDADTTPRAPRLREDDLRLEPLSLDHLDGIMTWVNDPEVTFYFAELGREITREEEAAYVEKLIASKTDRVFSIFGPDGYLGQIGLAKIYWPARNGRLGIMLPRHAQGRGVASAAGRLLLRTAFSDLGMHKVWAIIRSDNPRGLYLWTQLGFRCEGVLRDEYFVQDRFYDMVRLACTEADFLARIQP